MSNTKKNIDLAILEESEKFKSCYLWLEESMPQVFFQEITPSNMLLITHSLMGLQLQDYYSTIHLKGAAIVLCLDRPDADLRILEHYSLHGIKNYQAFVSNKPPPFPGVIENLRIANIIFTDIEEGVEKPLPSEMFLNIQKKVQALQPQMSQLEFETFFKDLGSRFIHSTTEDKLALAISMYFRAKTRDSCQYELQVNGGGSLQIVLAWKNTPKNNFLYRLARTIHRHKLVMKKVDATYVNPYSRESTLIMILDLHAASGEPVSTVCNIPDFMRELITVKYFASFDKIDEQLVSKGIISGNFANILRAMLAFVHQALVHLDPHLYSLDNIEEGLCRHPELTALLALAFKWKFHPENHSLEEYSKIQEEFLSLVNKLDTGQEENDRRRKNILKQAMNMIHYTLKTNAYRLNFTSLSFRLDPSYLDHIPFDRAKKFPELPFAIFFIKGMHFFGFHIRFKDLARGGLRTVFPEQTERMITERNNIFTECYNLAYTQHLKNKDIPEGGAKGIIFLKPFERLDAETEVYKKDLERTFTPHDELEEKIALFKREQTLEYLHQSQRAFIESLLILVNSTPDGTLRVRHIIDYLKKPEYLYLGPDENMHDAMIQWIADYSKKYEYKPGTAFISSKPKVGINHKEFGVTSLGVNVYLRELLLYSGINPLKDPFTIKMAGGPDGDVAGNQILNLYKHYKDTAQLIALTDISGTIYDPNGLDLSECAKLFYLGKAINHYPRKLLSKGGFLVDKETVKVTSTLAKQTLCFKNCDGKFVEQWLSSSEMNFYLRDNLFKTKADVFIPAGGRPRTLNDSNYHEFLDEVGKPSSKLIIEGANLYLTQGARRELEKLGVLIVRDSSANKAGVICSSFEVLSGLALGDTLFYTNKDELVKQILKRLELSAYKEAMLLINEHQERHTYLTDISAKISERINQFTYQLLDYLDKINLSDDPNDPLIQCYLSYCPPLLRDRFQTELLKQIPEPHKKAIIACHVGAQVVYKKGLHWFPSIVDVLPLVLNDLALKSLEC